MMKKQFIHVQINNYNYQNQQKASKLSKIKAKYGGKEQTEQEYILTQEKEPEKGIILPPFDEQGNKQGKWMKGSYQFGEWYYDLNGNHVFLSPGYAGDDIGDLYNSDSSPYMDFILDAMGNYLPIILMTPNNEYFQFLPNFELKFKPDSEQKLPPTNISNLQSNLKSPNNLNNLISFKDYNVNRILSTQKTSKNFVNVKAIGSDQIYFLQIPNAIESELYKNSSGTEIGEYDFVEEVEIIEEGEDIKIVQLHQLIQICSYFQLNEEISSFLVLQIFDLNCILDFITEEGYQYLLKSIDQLIREDKRDQIKKQILSVFFRQKLISPQIYASIFHPLNLKSLEKKIIDQQTNQITQEEQNIFQNWCRLLSFKVIQPNSIFNQEYDLKQDKNLTFDQVQQFLYKNINDQKINFLALNNNFQSSNKSILKTNLVNIPCEKDFVIRVINNYQDYIDSNKNNNFDQKFEFESCNISDDIVEDEQIDFNYESSSSLNKKVNKFSSLCSNDQPPQLIENNKSVNKKVYVEMRLKNHEKYRLATRSQSLDQIHFFFKKFEYPQSMSLIEEHNKLKIEMLDPLDTQAFIFFDIKDFNLNIDYEIVDKVFGLQDLAEYLKNRQIWYKDPINKKDQCLHIKKGIFIGEPFHDYLCYRMSCLIYNILLNIETGNPQIFSQRSMNYKYYQDDFLVEVHFQKISVHQIKQEISNYLKIVNQCLREIGMQLNLNKLQVFIQAGGVQTAWKYQENSKFIQCGEFFIMGRDVLKKNVSIMDQSIKDYVYKLAYKLLSTENKAIGYANKKSIIPTFAKDLTSIEKSLCNKLIRIYLDSTKTMNKSVKGVLENFLSFLKEELASTFNPYTYEKNSYFEEYS